ncbi:MULTISPECIES: GNAT family N-acetyltransferase [Hymenobacter]|uniref:Ribosomal protein S18 acetylase RimI n=1 Tax=Hymenobacter mucosus TaxID=1411120 RepID=A0A238VYZ4_9BACT|nr:MULTISPECIES: GNAT family N-acetyltransferase [Hymenobacter]SNR39550.1 Ribosomal protein S18 acetylase RimI [Hymenobacter mucosus]
MTIRVASHQDIDELYGLWRELMDEHQAYHPVFGYHPAAEFQLKRMLRHRVAEKNTRVFVAQGRYRILGLLVASYQMGNPGMHFFRRGYIAETVVRQAYRRHGLGRALFQAALAWLSSQGADHLELQVAAANPAALHFWESLGFTPTTVHLMRPLSTPGTE